MRKLIVSDKVELWGADMIKQKKRRDGDDYVGVSSNKLGINISFYVGVQERHFAVNCESICSKICCIINGW